MATLALGVIRGHLWMLFPFEDCLKAAVVLALVLARPRPSRPAGEGGGGGFLISLAWPRWRAASEELICCAFYGSRPPTERRFVRLPLHSTGLRPLKCVTAQRGRLQERYHEDGSSQAPPTSIYRSGTFTLGRSPRRWDPSQHALRRGNEREAGNAGRAVGGWGGGVSQCCCNLTRFPQKRRCWVICVFVYIISHLLHAGLLKGSGSAGCLFDVTNTVRYLGVGGLANGGGDPPVGSLGSSLIWSVDVCNPSTGSQPATLRSDQHTLISVCICAPSPPPPTATHSPQLTSRRFTLPVSAALTLLSSSFLLC